MPLPEDFDRIEDAYREAGVSPETFDGWKRHLERRTGVTDGEAADCSALLHRVLSKMLCVSEALRTLEGRLDPSEAQGADPASSCAATSEGKRAPLSLETLDEVIEDQRGGAPG